MQEHKYDVFLSYSRQDAEAAEVLARSLSDAGLSVWFDKWNLVPGQNWQHAFEHAIRSAFSVAVCVGPSRPGMWQKEELHSALKSQVTNRVNVFIPVLLPGAVPESLPSFLNSFSWIDFRGGLDDSSELGQLMSAIESAGPSGAILQEQRMGDNLIATGDQLLATEHYERALHTARSAYGDFHPRVSELLIRLAISKLEIGELQETHALLDEAQKNLVEVYGEYSTQVSTVMTNLGNIFLEIGDLGGAQNYFEQALVIARKIGDRQAEGNTLSDIGWSYLKFGEIDKAVDYYEQALEVYTREAYPERWAWCQLNLANAYRDRILGERADNLEQATQHCEQALEVYTREAYPERWAECQLYMANAYRDRIRGERADNLEQATQHYEQALEVYTREAYPEWWAWCQLILATTYQDRIRGERAFNLEQAILHCEQALEVFTREAYPERWAGCQLYMANAYRDRIRGERADNLEQAIHHYEQVLLITLEIDHPWVILATDELEKLSKPELGPHVSG